ncbi:MAG: VOC family protein [Planctomycetales bacterium]
MTKSNQPIPPGSEHLIPHLVCNGAAKAIEFYKQAFGAEVIHSLPAPDGKRIMHGAMRLGNSMFFLVDDFPEFCGGKSESPTALKGSPVTIHRYVPDVDAAVKRAVDAGATVIMPVADMFWGDRYGVIQDPFGHKWSIATHMEDLNPEQLKAAMQEAFAQSGH